MTDRPTLSDALDAWAKAEPAGAGDSEALARILGTADAVTNQAPKPAAAPEGWKPGWLVGGAVAASLAVALLLSGMPGASPEPIPAGGTGSPVMLAAADPDSSAAFALLYTPTTEEEYHL